MTAARKILSWIIKILCSAALLAAIAALTLVGWLYLYTLDLPDTASLAAFAPDKTTTLSTTICSDSAQITAIPNGDAEKLRSAILAAEGDLDPRGVFWRYLKAGYSDQRPRYGIYSLRLAHQMFCEQSRSPLRRDFREFRTAIQLERHFSNDQILTIYMNRLYFGPGIYGVENAAGTYFGKHAGDFSISEGALLAGLSEGPARFSPRNHPDRAIQRRNAVIEAMAQRGAISHEEAAAAELVPLATTSR